MRPATTKRNSAPKMEKSVQQIAQQCTPGAFCSSSGDRWEGGGGGGGRVAGARERRDAADTHRRRQRGAHLRPGVLAAHRRIVRVQPRGVDWPRHRGRAAVGARGSARSALPGGRRSERRARNRRRCASACAGGRRSGTAGWPERYPPRATRTAHKRSRARSARLAQSSRAQCKCRRDDHWWGGQEERRERGASTFSARGTRQFMWMQTTAVRRGARAVGCTTVPVPRRRSMRSVAGDGPARAGRGADDHTR